MTLILADVFVTCCCAIAHKTHQLILTNSFWMFKYFMLSFFTDLMLWFSDKSSYETDYKYRLIYDIGITSNYLRNIDTSK